VSLTFLIGGARSGKSTLAVRLATELGRTVTLIATAEPRDDDMAERIARHRAERPPTWTTLEVPIALGDAVASIDDRAVAIVDCLTLWVSNALEDGREEDAIVDEARTVAAALAGRDAQAIDDAAHLWHRGGELKRQLLRRDVADLAFEHRHAVGVTDANGKLVQVDAPLVLEQPVDLLGDRFPRVHCLSFRSADRKVHAVLKRKSRTPATVTSGTRSVISVAAIISAPTSL
jgi:adenosyl cobinamide kinase/adenosyl cobinamide phosphate guanylyltransferase